MLPENKAAVLMGSNIGNGGGWENRQVFDGDYLPYRGGRQLLGCPTQKQIDWLMAEGVTIESMIRPEPLRTATGTRGADGWFDPDPDGPTWLAIPEGDDCAFWNTQTGELASLTGKFALGEVQIDDAGTYTMGDALTIHSNPLAWLVNARVGIVVLDWSRAWFHLRDVPRVEVANSLAFTYRRFMRPRLPVVAILPDAWREQA